jgi:hypothetical protein
MKKLILLLLFLIIIIGCEKEKHTFQGKIITQDNITWLEQESHSNGFTMITYMEIE